MRRLLTAIGVVWASCSVALAAEPIEPTGRPPGVAPLASQNTRGFPAPNLTPGQPIETRPPELATDRPAFPVNPGSLSSHRALSSDHPHGQA